MTQIERANVVMKSVLSVAAILAMVAGLWAALNQGAQAAQKADVKMLQETDRAIIAREDQTDQRINRLISVVEINSTLMVEPKGSAEYAMAVTKLRAMRRIVSN
jgi:hypothetical protein